MFGSDHNQQAQDNQPPSDTPQVFGPQPPAPDPATPQADTPSYLPTVPSLTSSDTPAPALPDALGSHDAGTLDELAASEEPSSTPTAPEMTSEQTPAATPPTAHTDELLQLKQEALQQLSPLVGHLEQDPGERFKTFMMLIQASDDQTHLKAAYEAAQAITDEKVRAQALLDIVNEINYFTQKNTEV